MSALFATAILAAILVLRSTTSWDRGAEYQTSRDQSGGIEAILRPSALAAAQRTAALRDFGPASDRSGSKASLR